MPDWNELFADARNIDKAPEAEVYRFFALLEKKFPGVKLNFWDLGCGGGRHSVAAARLGLQVFASDKSPRALELTSSWAAQSGLSVRTKLSDMTENPFPDAKFHGALSWNVIQHNELLNIHRAVGIIHSNLLPGGLFMGALLSDKACGFGQGTKLEERTYAPTDGREAGVPHHYFSEKEMRDLFPGDKWRFLALAEQVTVHAEKPEGGEEYSPFRSTGWRVLAEKK